MMHYLRLMPKITGALLIFNDGTRNPPSVELSDADVAALIGMCQDYLMWREKMAEECMGEEDCEIVHTNVRKL